MPHLGDHHLEVIVRIGFVESTLGGSDGDLGAAVGTIRILGAADDQQRPAREQAKHARAIELIEHARRDVNQVKEPRFQALLETTAEVLGGLETAFKHYSERKEPAWKN